MKLRDDQGKYFWELRSCTYWGEFEQPKIMLRAIMQKTTFAFDTEGYYHNDMLYMIPGNNEYLVAILNSSVVWWYLCQVCPDLQNGFLKAQKEKLFSIPIPNITFDQRNRLVEMINNVKAAKYTDTSIAFEREIDEFVYELYGLNQEEIKIIEGKDENTN